jgi:site-specific recombinase XerD
MYNLIRHFIINLTLGKEAEKVEINLIGYINTYLDKAVTSNPELAAGTIRNYRKSVNHFKTYLHAKGKEYLFLGEVNNLLAVEFKEYLQATNPVAGKKGMSEVSASSIIKNLKPIFNRAINEGHLQQNPLKVLKLKHKSPQRDRLTIGHVKSLFSLDLKHISSLRAYQDIFMFSVFTGLANVLAP